MRKKIAITIVAVLLSLTVSGGAGEVRAAANVQNISAMEECKISEGIVQPKRRVLAKRCFNYCASRKW